MWIYFSHPSLVMYSFFSTPPIKRKLEQQIGAGLLDHLDESLWWANQKHWAAVKSYLLHSFLEVHSAHAPFTGHGNVGNFAEPNLHMVGFLHPILLCRITYWARQEMLLGISTKRQCVTLHWKSLTSFINPIQSIQWKTAGNLENIHNRLSLAR